MTALRYEAIKLVEQMPEEQMPYVIQYMNTLKDKVFKDDQTSDEKETTTPKMRAFLELERMLVPVSQEIDYDKELAEARNERYGYTD